MKLSAKQIATSAMLLAICIVSMFLKNTSVYLTGPIVNACLILEVLTCGLICSIILSVITPVLSFLITGAPIIAAVPLVMPMIMIGNIILVVFVWLFTRKINVIKKISLDMVIGGVVGAVAKALFMGIVIGQIILPKMLPEQMMPKLPVLQNTYSVTQLVTALIGIVYAYIIWAVLKKLNYEN